MALFCGLVVFSLSFHCKNEHAEKNINVHIFYHIVPYNKMSVKILGRV